MYRISNYSIPSINRRVHWTDFISFLFPHVFYYCYADFNLQGTDLKTRKQRKIISPRIFLFSWLTLLVKYKYIGEIIVSLFSYFVNPFPSQSIQIPHHSEIRAYSEHLVAF